MALNILRGCNGIYSIIRIQAFVVSSLNNGTFLNQKPEFP